MSYMNAGSGQVVAALPGEEKASFIRRTYGHLAIAIAAFALIEYQLISMGLGEKAIAILATSKWSWLLVLGAFMGVGMLANNWAQSNTSRELQYAGLGLYVVAEAIIFLPLIYMASRFAPASAGDWRYGRIGFDCCLNCVWFSIRHDVFRCDGYFCWRLRFIHNFKCIAHLP